MNHSLATLMIALGLRGVANTNAAITTAVKQAASVGKQFKAVVEWNRYCKEHKVSISTKPRKNKKNPEKSELPWPKAASTTPEKDQKGGYLLKARCPRCPETIEVNGQTVPNPGREGFGREFLANLVPGKRVGS